MPNEGVVYMAWGQKAREAAAKSIASLRQVSDYPVLVVGDAEVEELKGIAQIKAIELNPFRAATFLAGRVKPILHSLVPEEWERVLYVDADTTFRSSPALAFSLLGRGWDFLVAETGNRSLASQICGADEAEYTRGWFGVRDILYHNSGMLAWTQNERTRRLFELWGEEWRRFQHWDEQVALLRALARSDAMFLTLPMAWNTNFPSRAKLVFHQFGQHVASKFGRRRGVLTAAELRRMAKEMRVKAKEQQTFRPTKPSNPDRDEAVPTPIKPDRTRFNRMMRKPPRNLAIPEKEEEDGEPDV